MGYRVDDCAAALEPADAVVFSGVINQVGEFEAQLRRLWSLSRRVLQA